MICGYFHCQKLEEEKIAKFSHLVFQFIGKNIEA
jgi:hypothetical protein